MNPDRKRTLLAALLLSSACIVAVTAPRANEPQVKNVAAAKAGTVLRDCPDCPEIVGPRSTVRHQNQFQMKRHNIG
jgi:hypothetical protein